MIVDDEPFGPPLPPKQSSIADIVVRLDGAAAAVSIPADDVFSPNLVPPYIRMPVPDSVSKRGIFSNVLQRPETGRFLLRVGRSTSTIGPASLPVFADVMSDMLVLLIGLDLTPGKIFIYGSSSGGRNAIDFAAHVTRLGFKPHFVAAVDAAFFQADTPTRPKLSEDPDYADNGSHLRERCRIDAESREFLSDDR